MTRVLVHIGYHKTGSTWLQRELFNRTDRGFFPLTPDGESHGLDSRAFARRMLWVHPFEFDPDVIGDEVSRNVRGGLSACPVISHERLSGNPHSGGYDSKELASRIHAILPNAAVLIVIREQTSMILSCYHQYLLVGGACSLNDYLSKGDGIRPSFSLEHFRYHRLISHYQQLFGRDNTLVLPYELLSQVPARFISDLAQFSGAEIPADLPFDVSHNTGRGKFAATKTRWLNLFTCRNSLNGFSPLAPERSRAPLTRMKRLLGRIVPRSLEDACGRDQLALIVGLTEGYYTESNRITSDLIGFDLLDFGYNTIDTTGKSCAA